MNDTGLRVWQAQLLSTLDYDYANAPIDLGKAKLLSMQLEKGKACYLVLHSELCIEIINVVRVFHDIITIERGLKGTHPNVWPAGSCISAKITAKMLKDLRLDKDSFLKTNQRAVLTPDGDIITLVYE